MNACQEHIPATLTQAVTVSMELIPVSATQVSKEMDGHVEASDDKFISIKLRSVITHCLLKLARFSNTLKRNLSTAILSWTSVHNLCNASFGLVRVQCRYCYHRSPLSCGEHEWWNRTLPVAGHCSRSGGTIAVSSRKPEWQWNKSVFGNSKMPSLKFLDKRLE